MSPRGAGAFLLVALLVGAALAAATHISKPAVVLPRAPDTYRLLGAWALSGTETMRLVHIPDAPTGLRCLIYQNPQQTVIHCDDDLPR